jgi:hypothetical protein
VRRAVGEGFAGRDKGRGKALAGFEKVRKAAIFTQADQRFEPI